MRLLIIVLTILLLVAFVGFVATNYDAQVGVTVWKTDHENVPLYIVVFLAVLAGCLYAGIIGVAQGTQMWLINRRQTREVQKLETELNYLRTQPVSRSRSVEVVEPRRLESGESATDEPDDDRRALPSAPVYGASDDDPDDDVYSGGRAV